MMQILIGIVLSLFLIIILVISYKRSRDVFSPLVFFSLFQLLRYCTGLFYKTEEMGVQFTEENLIRFFVVESVAIWSVLFGYYLHQKYFYHPSIVYEERFQKEERSLPSWLVCIVFILGVSGRIRGIISAGGIGFILNNTRTAYLSGNIGSGYSSLLDKLMIVAIIMQMKRISMIPKTKNGKKFSNYVLLFIMIGVSMGSYLVYSRRSPALELLMIVVFAYNYLIKPIKLRDFLRPMTIIIVLIIVSVIIVMPAFRQGTTADFALSKVLNELSYLGRDIGCYDYFSQNAKWLGKSYSSLLMSPIPSALMQNKPPVDDGMYLYNIIKGYNVTPPIATRNMPLYNSYPFSTQGIMYANFGIIGVIIGEIIMGALYARVYKILRNTNCDFMVIAYQLIIYQLELSSLSIVQTLIPLLVSYFAYKTLTGFKIYKTRAPSNENK